MSKVYFCSSTLAFYNDSIHAEIPLTARVVGDDVRLAVQAEVALGKVLAADKNGLPAAVLPPTPVSESPRVCTPAQGLVALFALKNITEDNVLDAIAQIPDPVQQYTAKIGYQRATTWERGSPTMTAMAQLLLLSDADLDELFTYAVGVQV